MKTYHYILLALSVFLWACKSESTKKSLNGLDFIIHTQGKGQAIKDKDFVSVQMYNYIGDSLVSKPSSPEELSIIQVVPLVKSTSAVNPVMELIHQMKVGDSASIYKELLPLEQRVYNAAPGDRFKYTVVIKAIKTQEEVLAEEIKKNQMAPSEENEKYLNPANRQAASEVWLQMQPLLEDYNQKKLGNKLKSTSSGLKYVILENGSGAPGKSGNVATVSYYGAFLKGSRFDDSYSFGRPIEVTLGAKTVIPGWEEALTLFPKGTKACLFVPPHLAYGEKGNPPIIPPNEELMFFMEVVDIK
ncbi:MAG TPA: FKBP-type peptidyl-prolyl cis-trans isomerase [Saprospiraceae bacterium]|nr:FKBP-type peptidyl-prolyl cis-trans isomerase [Saprospiraceae bacterium]